MENLAYLIADVFVEEMSNFFDRVMADEAEEAQLALLEPEVKPLVRTAGR